jgi:hypothetical protein
MRNGAPFIVRNCRNRMNWDPSCMNRALKDTSPVDLEVQPWSQETHGLCMKTTVSHKHGGCCLALNVPLDAHSKVGHRLTSVVRHVQVVNCSKGFELQHLKRHHFFEYYKDQVPPAAAFLCLRESARADSPAQPELNTA